MTGLPQPVRMATVITAMSYGGAQRILADYLPLLPGFEHAVFCLYPGPLAHQLAERGIRVVEYNLRGAMSLAAVPRLVAEFRRWRPHIVHTHLGKADFVGRMAARIAGVPAIATTSHNTEDWKLNPLLNALDNLSLRQAHAVIAISNGVRDFLVERGVPAAKISVSYARAELRDRFAQPRLSPGRESALRAEISAPPGTLITMMVGRFHPQKAHDVALRAFAALPPANHILVMAGDGPLRAPSEALARELGIADRCRFLGNRGDVPDLLRVADIFAMPSKWEGAGLALMEAHAAALPAVISDAPGMSEVAADCRGSLSFPVGDHAAMAAAWQRLALDGAMRAELGARARDAALAHWDIRVLAEEYLAVYHRLLAVTTERSAAPG